MLSVVTIACFGFICLAPENPPKPTAAEIEKRIANLDDLWARHGGNFVSVGGKMYRLPSSENGLSDESPSVGQSGVFHKAKVMKVTGADEIIVAPIYTAMRLSSSGVKINASYSAEIGPDVLIYGARTSGVIDGQDWVTPHILIVGTVPAKLVNGGTKTILLAVTTEYASKGLPKDQFRKLIATEADLGPDKVKERQLEEDRVKRERQRRIDAGAEKARQTAELERIKPIKAAEGKYKSARLQSLDADEQEVKGNKTEAARMRRLAKEKCEAAIKLAPGSQPAEQAKKLLEMLEAKLK